VRPCVRELGIPKSKCHVRDVVIDMWLTGSSGFTSFPPNIVLGVHAHTRIFKHIYPFICGAPNFPPTPVLLTTVVFLLFGTLLSFLQNHICKTTAFGAPLFRCALADSGYVMQEIETLYVRESHAEPKKSCWFPFRKAYTQRPIQTDTIDDSLVLSVSLEIPPQDHVESQLVGDPSTPTEFHEHSPRSFRSVSDTYSNSIISEGDQLSHHRKSTVQNLAQINPNPLCKEFWVDELMHGGSWNCSASMFPAQGLSHDEAMGMQQSLQERSFAQETVSIGSHTLPELGLSQRPANDSSYCEEGQSTKYTGCSIRSRDFASHGCCTMKGTWHGRIGSIATSTDMSWADSETASTSQTDSQSGTMPSFESNNKANDRDNSGTLVVPSNKEVETSWTSMTNTGLLCAPMQWRKVEPPHSPIYTASFQKVPSAIKVCSQTPRSIDSLAKESNELPDVEMKAAGTGYDECIQKTNIDAPTPESAFSSSKIPGEEIWTKAEGSMTPVGCMPTVAMGSLSMAQATNVFLQSSWSMPTKERQDQVDPNLPHFYVEVEANKKRLKEIKDLCYIKAQEDRHPVDMARSSSLVDDDSAFIENQFTGKILTRLSPKRQSPARKQSSRVQSKVKVHNTAIATPIRPNEAPLALLPSGVSNRSAILVTPHRNARRTAIDTTQSSPRIMRQKIELAVPRTNTSNQPRESVITTKLISKNVDNSISRQEQFSGGNISSTEVPTLPTKPLMPKSRETVPSLKEENGKALNRVVPPKYLSVVHLKSRRTRSRESTTNNDHQSVVSELAQDFELARFPSLSSEDWQETSLETNSRMGLQSVSPPWWVG